jgi:hypothetical protein
LHLFRSADASPLGSRERWVLHAALCSLQSIHEMHGGHCIYCRKLTGVRAAVGGSRLGAFVMVAMEGLIESGEADGCITVLVCKQCVAMIDDNDWQASILPKLAEFYIELGPKPEGGA